MNNGYIKNIGVSINAMIAVDDYIYMSDRYSGGLFRFNIKNSKLDFCGDLSEDVDVQKAVLYYKILKYRDELYFIPFNAHSIGIYNIKTGKVSHIKLWPDIGKTKCKFVSASIIDEKLYMLGYGVALLIVFDLKKNQFCCVDGVNIKLQELLNNTPKWNVYAQTYVDGHIYAVIIDKNFLIDINMRKGDCSIIEIKGAQTGFGAIAKKKNMLFLCPYGRDRFVKYDIKNNTFNFYENKCEVSDWEYVTSIVLKNVFYALPCLAKSAIFIDIENDEIGEVKGFNCFADKRYPITEAISYGSFLFCNRQDLNEIITYNVDDGRTSVIKLVVEKYPISLIDKSMMMENKYFTLSNYVDYVQEIE